MATTSPSQPDSSGIRIGDVGGSVNFSALGDIVGGDKITTITTTIQISVEAITQRPLITASPYRGLDRFEDRDKDLFFGRDQLIKSLLAQLSGSNVLLVLGASGSGKSSVVRAGLLPQLAQLIGARFRYFTFVPDVNPFESLRSALQGAGFSQSQTRELEGKDPRPETPAKLIHTLQRSGDQWLFFVDQFEEIFTVGGEKLRASFIAALVAIAQDASSSTKLVLAMRADFLDRFSPFPEFAKIVEKNIDFVADMHADELRQAIEQPAARHGVVFEQGLAEEIIKDVQGQAGSLPLLQYTLDLLWQEEAREDGLADRHLNARAYRELGGVRGALQKRADEIYDSFGDGIDAKTAIPKQAIVRQIFLRLVDLAGEGSNDTAWRPVRRRTSMTIFKTAQEQEILRALINQKLLVSNREGDDATVEVAHEALFTSWGRLKNWIEAGKQVIFARNRLADDARRWQRRQRESDADANEELLGGSRLAQAVDMRMRGDFITVVGGLAETETQFLEASLALRDRRAHDEQARQQRELEAAQRLAQTQQLAAGRLRKGLVIALVLLMAAAGSGGVAYLKAKEAKESVQKAKKSLSDSDFLQAADLLDQKKTFEALAFLARACRTDPQNGKAATRLFSLLMQRNWVLPSTDPVRNSNSYAVEHVRFHPDGTQFVATTFGDDAQARVWETETGRLLLGPVSCNSVGFDYDSRPPLPDERSFHAREPWILVVALGKQVQIGDLATGEVRSPILEHETNVTVAQFSPDGGTVQTGDVSGKVVTWDARTGARSGTVQLPGKVLAFSRDGTRAIAAGAPDQSAESSSESREFQGWSLAGGSKATPLPIKGRGKFLAMSDDGQWVCSWTPVGDGLTLIHFWDVATGAETTAKLENVPPDGETIKRARFAPASRFMVSAAIRQSKSDLGDKRDIWTAQMRAWDPKSGKELSRILHESLRMSPMEGLQPYHVCLGPEATRVASLAFEDRSLRVSATRGGAALNEPPCSSAKFSDVTFHPDGTRILSGSFSGLAQVWDIRPTSAADDPMILPKFDRVLLYGDGKSVLLSSPSGEQRCFDTQTGQAIVPVPAGLTTHGPDSPRNTQVSRDGKLRLVFVEDDDSRPLMIKNATTGAIVRGPILSVLNAWFNTAGDRILISKSNGLTVLDLETGKELIDPLPYGDVRTAAFTADGLIAVEIDKGGALIHRFRFQLERAPALLPELAEAIAKHALNDFGIPEPRSPTVSYLRALGAKLDDRAVPPLMAVWMKWFFAPRETRGIGPENKKTMVEYLQQCIERGTPESLDEAELRAFGNKELQAKIAEQRARLPKVDP